MARDLTKGPVAATMLLFALPMVLGNLIQQLYNIADTLIVGRFLGTAALGAVGSAYTLMTFLTSVLLGLSMGSGAAFSIRWGRRDLEGLRQRVGAAFLLIAALTAVLTAAAFLLLDPILRLLQVPPENYGLMRAYLWVIFFGVPATFLMNFFSCLLRSVGDSFSPLLFLGASALLNIGLALLFVITFDWGVKGAAFATVLSQYGAGAGLLLWALGRYPQLQPSGRHLRLRAAVAREIGSFSFLTCVQQSVMNFGILMVQGRVNAFGSAVMAAFAAAVKIDSFAYMPVQDFGNAFSTFIAQNYGARRPDRIRAGIRWAVITASLFSLGVSAAVCLFARPLMTLFVEEAETEIIAIGVTYLRVEGAFYVGIGCLFLLYGLYRAVAMPAMSVVLTVISLGTRVVLAYTPSAVPAIGVVGIWWSVPIGWALADLVGFGYYRLRRREIEARLTGEKNNFEKEVVK